MRESILLNHFCFYVAVDGKVEIRVMIGRLGYKREFRVDKKFRTYGPDDQ